MVARRIAADYRPRLAQMGAELGVWANSTQIGVEIPAGGLGPRWANKVRYAYRVALIGRTMRLKTGYELDIELRGRIERWIQQRHQRTSAAER
jgi:hypothetical protein